MQKAEHKREKRLENLSKPSGFKHDIRSWDGGYAYSQVHTDFSMDAVLEDYCTAYPMHLSGIETPLRIITETFPLHVHVSSVLSMVPPNHTEPNISIDSFKPSPGTSSTHRCSLRVPCFVGFCCTSIRAEIVFSHSPVTVDNAPRRNTATNIRLMEGIFSQMSKERW